MSVSVTIESDVLESRERESRCDCCHAHLDNARLIAGEPGARLHFCSFACYDRWKGNLRGE
jgi:hypothetical protein